MLTRSLLLGNTARIFDPLGLFCLVILESKLLMRESFLGKSDGWEDSLPDELSGWWLEYLTSLVDLNSLKFHSSLWPAEEVVGLPVLIVFSDGSQLALGTAAYIRWELSSGGYWCSLITSKSKIAPKNLISIPPMELNDTVLGNRVKTSC